MKKKLLKRRGRSVQSNSPVFYVFICYGIGTTVRAADQSTFAVFSHAFDLFFFCLFHTRLILPYDQIRLIRQNSSPTDRASFVRRPDLPARRSKWGLRVCARPIGVLINSNSVLAFHSLRYVWPRWPRLA